MSFCSAQPVFKYFIGFLVTLLKYKSSLYSIHSLFENVQYLRFCVKVDNVAEEIISMKQNQISQNNRTR